MQHPKDVKGSDRPLPRNDGKFVLDGKRVEFSDYGGSSKVSIGDRLDYIESTIEDIEYVVAKETLALSKIEERIAMMEDKINGVDQEEDSFEELSNEEYLLADKICLEIKEYMSQFVDTDEKVVDNLCEIVKHRIVGGSDGID